jgi:hypothetical protein
MKKILILSSIFVASLAQATNLNDNYASSGSSNQTNLIKIAPKNLSNKQQGLGFNVSLYSIYTNFNGIHEESGFLEIKGNLSTNGKQFTQSLADNIVYNPDTSSQIWVSFDQLEFKVKPDNTIIPNTK